ncbi:MAG: hypothetical protein RIR51_1239 [Bacteroidota bacterium]
MRNPIILIIISWVFSVQFSFAQDSLWLNSEQYLNIVKTYHPVVRQADISVGQSEAEILLARSNFDPILRNIATQKTVDGKDYYLENITEVAIPTWYGIELIGGRDNLRGTRINTSETQGLTNYAGISIPLAKDLIIDKRRAALKKAKIMNTLAEDQRRGIVNDLMNEAISTYWTWVKSFQVLQVYQDFEKLNQIRFTQVKKAFELGDIPAIDTVEALTQLQYIQTLIQQSQMDFNKASLEASIYLWDENQNPLIVLDNIFPQDSYKELNIPLDFIIDLELLKLKAAEFHPDLMVYNSKLKALAIEKQLKFQGLLPKINFNYLSTEIVNKTPALFSERLGTNNFYYGLKMEIPLRLSQGRAEYKLAKQKLEFENLNRSQKLNEINVKIEKYFQENKLYKSQIGIQEQNYENYLRLLNAEQTKFFTGESSLFKINAREIKALEVLNKLISVKINYYKSFYCLQWSAGLLY